MSLPTSHSENNTACTLVATEKLRAVVYARYIISEMLVCQSYTGAVPQLIDYLPWLPEKLSPEQLPSKYIPAARNRGKELPQLLHCRMKHYQERIAQVLLKYYSSITQVLLKYCQCCANNIHQGTCYPEASTGQSARCLIPGRTLCSLKPIYLCALHKCPLPIPTSKPCS